MAGSGTWQVSDKNPEIKVITTNDPHTKHLYRVVNLGPGHVHIATTAGQADRLSASSFRDYFSQEMTILIDSDPSNPDDFATGTLEYLGYSAKAEA